MKINWSLRFHNKVWLTTLLAVVCTFMFNLLDLFGIETTVAQEQVMQLGAALLSLGLIAGEDSEYGLYVKTVNDVTVDYDQDGKYWAFYVDGEYAATGVDSTDITAGATYTFKAE